MARLIVSRQTFRGKFICSTVLYSIYIIYKCREYIDRKPIKKTKTIFFYRKATYKFPSIMPCDTNEFTSRAVLLVGLFCSSQQ